MGIDILIIDHEENGITKITENLKGRHGICLYTENKTDILIQNLKIKTYNIILLNVSRQGLNAAEHISKIKSFNPLCNVIVMIKDCGMFTIIECIEAGACDYILLPVKDVDLFLNVVSAAVLRVKRWKETLCSPVNENRVSL